MEAGRGLVVVDIGKLKGARCPLLRVECELGVGTELSSLVLNISSGQTSGLSLGIECELTGMSSLFPARGTPGVADTCRCPGERPDSDHYRRPLRFLFLFSEL